jgi:D-arginine dehydrogenase
LSWDVVVVGAGIAGASVAATLAEHVSVLVLEKEAHPGYHATGRSAALFSEIYGGAPVRALSRASRDFLCSPPGGFSDVPLVHDRGSLFIARRDQLAALEAFVAAPDVAPMVRRVAAIEANSFVPILRAGYVAGAAYEEAARDLDVHAIHQAYLRALRARGGAIRCDAEVRGIDRVADGFTLTMEHGEIVRAGVLVNAAGAWADDLAALAGVERIGLSPRRRTALTVDIPSEPPMARAPMTIDIDEAFYFKPDAGRLLLSPADETPSPPLDAKPDDLDVAMAVDRVERATTLQVRRIVSKWAGLRTFAPDRAPVVGYDERVPGFFWLAGQGGYGIQTAPAMARLAAALVRRLDAPDDVVQAGLSVADVSPRRFAR